MNKVAVRLRETIKVAVCTFVPSDDYLWIAIDEIERLEARNARLLAALRFYAATESYMTLRLRTEYGKEGNQRLGTDRPDVIIDNGNRARAAIAAEEKEQSK